jgi:molybdopterin synthase catalytic subunit
MPSPRAIPCSRRAGRQRFARNGDYAEPATPLEDGDEVAFIPPVSGGANDDPAAAVDRRRILQISEEPIARTILADLEDRLATDQDGAVVGFLGRTRVSPGTPAPGQEAEAARHAGRSVESLGYEAHEAMALRVLGQIADEIAERFGVERLAIVHRTGDRSAGEHCRGRPHRVTPPFPARPLRLANKARAPIWKAGAVPRRSRLDRRPARTAAAGPSRPSRLTRGRRTVVLAEGHPRHARRSRTARPRARRAGLAGA